MKRKEIHIFLFSIILILLSALFTFTVYNGSWYTVDNQLQPLFTSWNSSFIEKTMKSITYLAYTKTLALISSIAILVLLIRKSYAHIFHFMIIMGVGIVGTFFMKINIARERPEEVSYVDFWGFGGDIISYSFPSGHAVKSLLFFGFMIYVIQLEMKDQLLKSSITVLFITLILLVGLGQIMLNRHYVTDVIGGYFVSFSWIMFYFSANRLLSNLKIWNG
ncbi:phosphatase PAP2 family protein [Evansella sp. AB-P1]|uniref:phosphatase PAP2 family protein n=1 Tax=Evansella sp. AB-P1 TaxID=3037653 RepID=UPI00241C65DB|nr:phosphatase PAP2 family protein [Evansella sp. AB-P1]MDG5789812.1 phosphatase PAP2 family protein [Evansella sp. AB-P1]